MIAWLKRQNSNVIIMLILCIMLLIGIILSWEHVSSEAGDAFKGLFQKADTLRTAPIE